MVFLSIEVIHGNLFSSDCQTLVNTVNCEGVMGAGIALEFKLRHADMFRRYVDLCRRGQLDIGKLWLYKPAEGSIDTRWVLNFPTKRYWRLPTKREFLVEGLENFVATHRERGIKSIAFPLLGASHGKMDEDESQELMIEYLGNCDIPIEVYRYDPDAEDELYERFREALLQLSESDAKGRFGRQARHVSNISSVVIEREDIRLISQLTKIRGIGFKSVDMLMNEIFTEDSTSADELKSEQLALI